MVANKTDAKARTVVALLFHIELINGVFSSAVFLSSWSPNSAMSPYPGVTNRAQPEGYFMLRKSWGK
jgi:hypothetical protein